MLNKTKLIDEIAPRLVALALVLLIAWQLASITWKLFASPEPDIGISAQVGQTGTASPSGDSVTRVSWAALPLFGKPSVVKPVADDKRLAQVSADEKRKSEKLLSELGLQLIGVIDSTNADNSYIVVKDKGGVEIYRVGDEIRDGISISDIQPKAFVLSRSGVETTIYIMDSSSSQTSTTATSRASVKRESSPSSTEFRVTNPAVRDRIEGYRETMKQNPLELMNKVRTSLVNRDGQPYGLRLRPGSDRMLLTNVGLRSGDILLSVNNVSVTDVSNLDTVMGSLSQGNSINLKIERAGKVRDLSVILDN